MKENPIHIINVSIKQADTEDDDTLVTAFTGFAHSKVSILKIVDLLALYAGQWLDSLCLFQKALLYQYGIRRVTFLVAQKVNAHIQLQLPKKYCQSKETEIVCLFPPQREFPKYFTFRARDEVSDASDLII